jgi:hypothetical protein
MPEGYTLGHTTRLLADPLQRRLTRARARVEKRDSDAIEEAAMPEEQRGGEEVDAQALKEQQGSEERKKAEEAKERYEKAEETVKGLEEDPPKKLEDWPTDEAKYRTFGGGEGDHGYDEGPEAKLGPSEVRHFSDGSVEVQGEKVDDPEEFKGEPIPGGPTDPETRELPGEKRKKEKMERMYGDEDEASAGDGRDSSGSGSESDERES